VSGVGRQGSGARSSFPSPMESAPKIGAKLFVFNMGVSRIGAPILMLRGVAKRHDRLCEDLHLWRRSMATAVQVSFARRFNLSGSAACSAESLRLSGSFRLCHFSVRRLEG
jgi:hypothetical protein